MKLLDTPLAGIKILTLDVFGDERGFFVERFHQEKFSSLGLPTTFVQDNHSRSAPGVLRGLHAQNTPSQAKLVSCTRGKIFDVAVDIRPKSPSFGQSFGLELQEGDGLCLWIPEGFLHGFCVLGQEIAEVQYKCTSLYNPQAEFGVSWSDPELNIKWPVKTPTLSEKDKHLPSFATLRKKLL